MLYFLAVLFIQGSASIFGTSEHLLLLTIGSCTSRVYIVIAAIDIAVNEFEVGLGPEGRAAEGRPQPDPLVEHFHRGHLTPGASRRSRFRRSCKFCMHIATGLVLPRFG